MAYVAHVVIPRAVTTSASPRVLDVGLVAAVGAVIISALSRSTSSSTAIGTVPIVMALIALAIGIPHGAIDNLTLVGELGLRTRLLLTALYLSIAGLAALAIYSWPAIAFAVVIAMTVWHFGSGDVEATGELRGRPPVRGAWRIVYALALGSAPVLLPLTSPAAVATVTAIEPKLAVLMSDGVLFGVRIAVLLLVVVTLLWLIDSGDLRGAVELLALSLLGYLASPLLAFAAYFGFWHALRHTARLAMATSGNAHLPSLLRVSRGGLPSLLGFVVVVAVLGAAVDPSGEVGPMLWIGLVAVWGLTVPHMLLVSRFDARMRAARS